MNLYNKITILDAYFGPESLFDTRVCYIAHQPFSNNVYIGQTTRHFKTRVSEHLGRSPRTGNPSHNTPIIVIVDQTGSWTKNHRKIMKLIFEFKRFIQLFGTLKKVECGGGERPDIHPTPCNVPDMRLKRFN